MEIVRKLEARAEPGTARVSTSPQDRLDREVVFRVQAETLGDMKKRAAVTLEAPAGSTFEIVSDEGAHLGGEDTAPPPLSYFSAAIAFWLLTQLSRFGKVAKMDVRRIRLEQVTRFYQKGSVLKRTMTAGCLGLETHVHVESDEPPERIRDLLKMGEQTCFTLGALTEQVPTTLHATLNGQALEPEA